MTGLSSYLRRGGLALVAIGIGGFVADYLLNVGLSRALEPHAFGDYRVARAFAFFFGSAVLLGGDRAGPKALAGPLARGEPAAVWEYLRFYLRLSLALSLLVIAATWLIGALHVGAFDPRHHHALAWMVVTVPVLAAGALESRTLQSALFPVHAALPWRIGLPVLILAAVAGLRWAQPTVHLEQVVILSIVATLVVAGWQWWRTRRLALPELRRDPAVATPRRWLQASVPMMGVFLVTLALNQSDLYFLELLGAEHEVGFYAAAETTAHFLILVQTTVVAL
ncbi:MAG: hypothetical protein R2909_24275, partial [Gemmatimonadales bacterium]